MFELSKLFGSEMRVKIIRVFLRNQDITLNNLEVSKKCKVKEDLSRKELVQLEKSGLLIRDKNSREIAYKLNREFRFRETLYTLMFDFKSASRDAIKERFVDIGRMKLLMLSGVFVGDENTRCDILYVGEAVKVQQKDKLLAEFESEVGFPLRIEIIDLEEYNYRFKMFDRYLRDALYRDTNEFLVDKVGINK